jgi:hypothetical protein
MKGQGSPALLDNSSNIWRQPARMSGMKRIVEFFRINQDRRTASLMSDHDMHSHGCTYNYMYRHHLISPV